MGLYALAGQPSAALRQYQLCVQSLAEELGLSPSDETTALYERIRSGAELGRAGRTAEPPARPRHNLPPQATPFVGREKELEELDALIGAPEVRLITILGPGGVGKTRLALAAAERQLTSPTAGNSSTHPFHDGVIFVPLDVLSDAERMVPALADALNLRLYGGEAETRTPQQQLSDFLGDKHLLLLLDNCEHLLAGMELVAALLRAAPGVKVLATSRERLNLQQEQLYPLHGFDVPECEDLEDVNTCTAARLFLQSARRVEPSFQLARLDELTDLTEICRLVEGLPLALEMAAGWVAVLSLAEIAAEIGRSLDLLETELRDVPARHRSMRAVFDRTWELLSETEREVLACFSVFRGGCTRATAQQVTGASLRTLAGLVSQSLLQYRQMDGRYQMHALLRQYAADRLAQDAGKEAAARDAHSAFYCRALDRWEKELNSARQGAAVQEIRADYANVHAAWMWAVEQTKLQYLATAFNGLAAFYRASGWPGGELTIEKAIEKIQVVYGLSPTAPDTARLVARLLTWTTVLSQGEYGRVYDEQSENVLRHCLALLALATVAQQDTRAEEAFVRRWLGVILGGAGGRDHLAEGRDQLETSLRLYRTLGDDSGAADALYQLYYFALADGAPERARDLLNEGLALLRRSGDPQRLAGSLAALANVFRELREYGKAQEMLDEAFAVSQSAGQLLGMEVARLDSAFLAWFVGDFDAALSYSEESLTYSRQAGSRRVIAKDMVFVGLTHLYRGEFARAAELVQEAMTVDPRWPNEYPHTCLAKALIYSGAYQTGRARAEAAGIAEGGDIAAAWTPRVLAWAALAEEKPEEALAWAQKSISAWEGWLTRPSLRREWQAWSRAPLARALYGLGRGAEAKRELYGALQSCVEIAAFLPLLHLLPIIAVVLADAEDSRLRERAVELYALAESRPMVAQSRLFEDIAGVYVRSGAAPLQPEVVTTAQARGRALDWWETAEAVLTELRESGWADSARE
jgi:predicted ATPase